MLTLHRALVASAPGPEELRRAREVLEAVAGDRSLLAQLPEEGLDLEAHLERIRAEMMRQALGRTGGVQTQAAELLGMTFRSFRYYARKSGLTGS